MRRSGYWLLERFGTRLRKVRPKNKIVVQPTWPNQLPHLDVVLLVEGRCVFLRSTFISCSGQQGSSGFANLRQQVANRVRLACRYLKTARLVVQRVTNMSFEGCVHLCDCLFPRKSLVGLALGTP
jgi:hypothetical protein